MVITNAPKDIKYPNPTIYKIENEEDPNALINGLADTLFPFSISQGQLDFLKEVLIPGLPDFEWTIEYSEYLAEPDNPDKREVRLIEVVTKERFDLLW